MIKKKTRPNDINVIASQIVAEATKEETPSQIPQKNPAAVALGRLGGLKGGPARAKKLSSKKRQDIAKKAAIARWKSIKKTIT